MKKSDKIVITTFYMKGVPFKVVLEEKWYKPGDIISNEPWESKLQITKVYKFTWLRMLLVRLGFNVRFYNGKIIKDDTR